MSACGRADPFNFFLFTSVYILTSLVSSWRFLFKPLVHERKFAPSIKHFLKPQTPAASAIPLFDSSVFMHAPSWHRVYINEQYEAAASKHTAGCSIVSIFSGNFCCECTAAFTVSTRGSWCRQCFLDCSTEHFALRSQTLGLVSAFCHQRRWHGGTWTHLTSERCHVT